MSDRSETPRIAGREGRAAPGRSTTWAPAALFVGALALAAGVAGAASVLGSGPARGDGDDAGPGALRARHAAARSVPDAPLRDDRGRPFAPLGPGARIVSLVPSLTDVLVAAGLERRLAARTRYDAHPELEALPSVGGAADPSVETVVAEAPELVVFWGDAGDPGRRTRLGELGVRVYTARIYTLVDVRRHARALGRLLGEENRIAAVLGRLDRELEAARAGAEGGGEGPALGGSGGRPGVLFLLWTAPPTVAGPGSHAQRVIEWAGARNVFADGGGPWITPSPEAVVARAPDVVVLPRDAGDGGGADTLVGAPWSSLAAVREGRVVRVDPEPFVRPGLGTPRAVRILTRVLAWARGPAAGEGQP